MGCSPVILLWSEVDWVPDLFPRPFIYSLHESHTSRCLKQKDNRSPFSNIKQVSDVKLHNWPNNHRYKL